MSQLARDRILSARGLDGGTQDASGAGRHGERRPGAARYGHARRYDRLEAEFIAGGG